MRTHHLLSCLAVAAAAAGCGDSDNADEAWSVAASAQSSALSSPGGGSEGDGGRTLTLAGGNGAGTGCAGASYGFATGPCTVVATAREAGGMRTFEWRYTSMDSSGPGADLFGVIVDGQAMPISDPGGAPKQSGRLTVAAGQTLAFFINCTDCTDGAAQATVTSIPAP
jgi:hypothetical protein